MDPFASFATLAANIKHAEGLLNGWARFNRQLYLKFQLLDVARSAPTLEDIIVVWNVVDISNFVNTIQQANVCKGVCVVSIRVEFGEWFVDVSVSVKSIVYFGPLSIRNQLEASDSCCIHSI